MIDLHIHSTCSDGTFTPKQIVQKVIAKGLYGFSLTDHDTVDGIPEILAIDLPDNLKFIPGIEISCDALHREIHVLGYGITDLRLFWYLFIKVSYFFMFSLCETYVSGSRNVCFLLGKRRFQMGET